MLLWLLLLEVADVISSLLSRGRFMSSARLFFSRALQFASRPLDGGGYKAMISFLFLFSYSTLSMHLQYISSVRPHDLHLPSPV